MSKLLLKTTETNGATIGNLVGINGEDLGVTIERQWLDNEPNISCVPAGIYKLIPHDSPRFGKTYALENEELDVSKCGRTKRTYCLFGHVGNTVEDVTGCVAFGWRVIFGREGVFITDSRSSTEKVLKYIKENGVTHVEIQRELDKSKEKINIYDL